MANEKHFHILALDGGGTRGIYSAQVLANVEVQIGAPIRDSFDLIAGTSTGSIVAGAAATGIPLKEVVELFEQQALHIFPSKRLRWGIFRSRYPRKRLEDVIDSCLPNTTLGEIATPLIITSSNIATGGVHVFKSSYLAELGEPYVRDSEIPLVEAILASCAAPSYFDPVQVGENHLADGGLWANNPSILAVTEAISKFKQTVDQIHILSIGTGHPTKMYSHHRHWGLATGWGHKKLVSYFLNLQSQSSSNMAGLILGERYVRLDPEIEEWALDDTKHLSNLKALATRDFAHRSEEILKTMRR
ncbi:MAG: patatin-like phospholipase family protein [Chloroflexi bacterium]|nr:patatin-like phospholipase family protein [Chloroflexota bacterium]